MIFFFPAYKVLGYRVKQTGTLAKLVCPYCASPLAQARTCLTRQNLGPVSAVGFGTSQVLNVSLNSNDMPRFVTNCE